MDLRKSVSFKKGFGRVALMALLVLFPFLSKALGPHEVVVVYNDEFIESRLLALIYARLRSIPERNLIGVSVPLRSDGSVPLAITKEAFVSEILEPVRRGIEAAQLSQQILAWVYSCGFPTRIADSAATLERGGDKDLSITGATFLEGNWPDAQVVRDGSYVSVLYADPSKATEEPRGSASFDWSHSFYLSEMPIPAAMLAYIGKGGTTLSEAEEYLERAASVDSTRPGGIVWLQKSVDPQAPTNLDVRTTCRLWEYEPGAKSIRKFRGADAAISTNLPSASDGAIIGMMAGTRSLAIPQTLVPGIFAEHLTSFAAEFGTSAQMKATEWLKKGAAMSSGTVVEPYALWTKFPTAWIFSHMLDGCTTLESFYSSVRCPLQQLPLGDPLAKPWAPLIEPVITGPGELVVSGLVSLKVATSGDVPDSDLRYTWLVDGRPTGAGSTFIWNTRHEENGAHRVRAVARTQDGRVRYQGFAEIAYIVENGGHK